MLENWNVFTEILNIFKVPFEVTNALQNPSMTLSDFYANWLKTIFKLERLVERQHLQTDFAPLLLEKLLIRKIDLLHNAPMLMAIYLDPRMRFNLTPNEMFIAKMNLEKIHKRIEDDKRSKLQAIESSVHNISIAENDDDDSFQKFLADMATEQNCTTNVEQADEQIDFNDLLNEYEKSCPFHNVSVLKFWESKRNDFPVLYELATIINSIPPTQTTVERHFSFLNFFFSVRRYNLDPKMLQDILMIKTNELLARENNKHEKDKISGENDDFI